MEFYDFMDVPLFLCLIKKGNPIKVALFNFMEPTDGFEPPTR
jgi:hypothetical protein